jgi:hypothetical protein
MELYNYSYSILATNINPDDALRNGKQAKEIRAESVFNF